MRGRKSLLTIEVQNRLVAQLRASLGVKASARAIQLPIPSLFRWLARGRVEQSGPYRDLHQAVQAAIQSVLEVA